MPTIDIDEQLKNQLKALKSIVAAKTYNEVVNLLIRQYDAKSYYEPMLTLVLDRLDTIEHKINKYTKIQKAPAYKGTQEDLDLIESLSRERILLLLEKIGIPPGYERKMVTANNKLFEFKESDKNYLRSTITEKKIIPVKEDVEDGPYMMENYVPRILFVFNKIVLIDFLQKVVN